MTYLMNYMLCRLALAIATLLVIGAFVPETIAPENVADIIQKVDGWLIFFSGWVAHNMGDKE